MPTDAKSPARRVVLFCPAIPHDSVPNAGEKYVGNVVKAYEQLGFHVTVVAEDVPRNVEALTLPGRPDNVILVSGGRDNVVIARLDVIRHKIDPLITPIPFLLGVRKNAQVREAMRQADVIDMQQVSSMSLLAIARRDRKPTFVTFHDAPSQLYGRLLARSTGFTRVRYAINVALSKVYERIFIRAATRSITLSQKDADLLPLGRTAVLNPPIYELENAHSIDAGKRATNRVVFVSFIGRPENTEAVLALMRDIWPQVLRRHPSAVLELVGKGAGDEVRAEIAASTNVEYLGFVPDLDAIYHKATCSVVPLRRGAGIKFKTIESLVNAIPTVTTHIGAEGIGSRELFACLSDDATTLAEGICKVLDDPNAAFAAAESVAERVRHRFSVERHRTSLAALVAQLPQSTRNPT